MSCKHPERCVLCLGHLAATMLPLWWCGWCGAIKHGHDGKWSKPATTKPAKRSKAKR